MNTYYEYIKTKINGMISSSFMDVFELKIDFNDFLNYLEQIYQISESNFDYHVFYNENKTDSDKEFTHYVTLDNGIYVDIKTCANHNIETNIIDMKDTIVCNLTAYSSQTNNKKLINFMNVVNTFIIKNKKLNENV
jgi:hypothetical protein